jgi:hypothetical protein
MNETETRTHWLSHHLKLWMGPLVVAGIGVILLPTLFTRHTKLQGALESAVTNDTVRALIREQGELTSGLQALFSSHEKHTQLPLQDMKT